MWAANARNERRGAAAERRLVYDVLGKGEAQTVTIVLCQYY
jgi:hypothetical protein